MGGCNGEPFVSINVQVWAFDWPLGKYKDAANVEMELLDYGYI